MKGDSIDVRFDAYNPSDFSKHSERTFSKGTKWLFAVDSSDQADGRHQWKILITMRDDHAPSDASTAHALGDTFGELVMKSATRGVEIGLAIRGEISKLFKTRG